MIEIAVRLLKAEALDFQKPHLVNSLMKELKIVMVSGKPKICALDF